MKNISFLLFCLIGLFACNSNSEQQTVTASPKAESTAQQAPAKPKIRKAPVSITPSPETDYPQVVRDLGFPIHPKTEVANVGNAIIDGDGLFMRLNADETLEKLIAFYDKGMVEKGWTKVDLKIFQGADKAVRYEKDGVVCRIIMIDEDNYIKAAVNMTKKINPADYEDR